MEEAAHKEQAKQFSTHTEVEQQIFMRIPLYVARVRLLLANNLLLVRVYIPSLRLKTSLFLFLTVQQRHGASVRLWPLCIMAIM